MYSLCIMISYQKNTIISYQFTSQKLFPNQRKMAQFNLTVFPDIYKNFNITNTNASYYPVLMETNETTETILYYLYPNSIGIVFLGICINLMCIAAFKNMNESIVNTYLLLILKCDFLKYLCSLAIMSIIRFYPAEAIKNRRMEETTGPGFACFVFQAVFLALTQFSGVLQMCMCLERCLTIISHFNRPGKASTPLAYPNIIAGEFYVCMQHGSRSLISH